MTVVSACTQGLMDSTHPQALLSRLNEQRIQGLFCDITIVVEDVKFRAHRAILAACSGYFRSALTSPDVWTSSQVLELVDLRSEVFASILNFIYCSTVTSLPNTEDTGCLVAAGKRLGIPFLEKQLEQDRQALGWQQIQTLTSGRPVGPCKSKKEGSRSVEPDNARGPRITNAFSITQVGPGNNPFTQLDLHHGTRPSPDHEPTSVHCPAPSLHGVNKEHLQALSEHSYAVASLSPDHKDAGQGPRSTEQTDSSQGPRSTEQTDTGQGPRSTEQKDAGQGPRSTEQTDASQGPRSAEQPDASQGPRSTEQTDASQRPRSPDHTDASQRDNINKPTQFQPKALANRNSVPLKKRHRLRTALSKCARPILAVAQDPTHATVCSSELAKATVQPVLSPPSLWPQTDVHTGTTNELSLAVDNGYMDLDPPPLSPHTEDSISIYGCEHCPEIFTQKTLLNVHAETHKKRFVSHLFCRFCCRKFMHLKRLRNHEAVCPKVPRGSPEPESQDQEARAEFRSDNIASVDHTVPDVQLASPELPDPLPPTGLQVKAASETEQTVDRLLKPGGGQRVYNCSVCKRVYVTPSSLRRHENVHSWQRAYPCHYCNKVFALAEYRTKHEVWHTGERRYQCIFCLDTFMTYYVLKNHQKASHGIDPRLSVNKKSANGGFKGSVYPIKLYRLLPMKFRKRRYKTYSQTYSEGTEHCEQAPLGCSSPIPPLEDGSAMSNADAALLSMPVTFMATPKAVAAVIPRICFDQHCDQDAGPVKQTSEHNGKPYTTPINTIQAGGDSPELDYGGRTFQTFNSSEASGYSMPFLEVNPPSSLNRLCSAAAQRIKAMTSQLFLTGSESMAPGKATGGNTEMYLAKPACPGPSVDGHVLPLCQITVKIGNEAIMRRRIKGSKLFPRKRKKSYWSQEGESGRDHGQVKPAGGSVDSPSLRFRTEVSSVIEPEPCEDHTDRDTADMLWRPYYTYKSKKKAKKLRSKQRKERRHLRYPMTSAIVPEAKITCLKKPCTRDKESISSESIKMKQRLRNSSEKKTYTCDICASNFITASGLRAHVIGCHPTFCRTCGKHCPPGETPSSSCGTTEDSRDYVCKSCMENGSCFDNSARSSSSEKRFCCSFCPQRFLYLATKKSHEKKHQDTSGKGYDCDDYYRVPKTTVTFDQGLNLKMRAIKTEEAQYSTDVESRASAGSQGDFSTGKTELKLEEWEDVGDYISVAPKKEHPFKINNDRHHQSHRTKSKIKVSKSSSGIDTFFPLSPSEVQHRKAKKHFKYKDQHQASLTSKRQKEVDYKGRETASHKAIVTAPGAEKKCSYGHSSPLYVVRDSVTKGTSPSSPKSEKHTYNSKKSAFFKHTTYNSGGKYL